MIDSNVDPAEFPAVNVYVACEAATTGVPEMVHEVGERASPAGRAAGEDSTQDVTAVPPVQAIVIGWIVIER